MDVISAIDAPLLILMLQICKLSNFSNNVKNFFQLFPTIFGRISLRVGGAQA